MLLKEGKIGMFIIDEKGAIGHIIDLESNSLGETIFVVKFSNRSISSSIHPSIVNRL